MTDVRPAEREALDALVEAAGTSTPDYVDEALAATRQVRQRPAWLARATGTPGGPASPMMILRIAPMAALLVIVALLTGTVSPVTPAPAQSTQGPTAVADPSIGRSSAVAEASGRAPVHQYDACRAPAAAPITLRVWDQATDAREVAVLEDLDAAFMASNPDVRIVRRHVDAATAATLTEDQPGAPQPDVVQVAGSPDGLPRLAAAGLLLPLDDAAATYDWASRWPASLLDRTRIDASGSAGSGTLYGVSSTASVLGMYFNYDLARARPARPAPAVLADELDDLKAMAEAGHVPLVVAGADGGLTDLYTIMATAAAGAGWTRDLVLGRQGATFDIPGARRAAELLLAMVQRGYLDPGYATLTSQGALERFRAGTGELLVSTSDANQALNAGGAALSLPMFTEMPPADAAATTPAVVRLGPPWVVRRDSAHAACAGALVDYVASRVGAEALAVQGLVPAATAYGSPDIGGASLQDITTILRAAARARADAYPLEDAFPGARAVIADGLAEMIAGDLTPAAFTARVQSAYQAYVGSR